MKATLSIVLWDMIGQSFTTRYSITRFISLLLLPYSRINEFNFFFSEILKSSTKTLRINIRGSHKSVSYAVIEPATSIWHLPQPLGYLCSQKLLFLKRNTYLPGPRSQNVDTYFQEYIIKQSQQSFSAA